MGYVSNDLVMIVMRHPIVENEIVYPKERIRFYNVCFRINLYVKYSKFNVCCHHFCLTFSNELMNANAKNRHIEVFISMSEVR